MSNAESDSYELRAVEEVTPGVTPASAMDIVRNTGEDLNFNITSEVSDEINKDGQISDLTQTGASSDGSFNFRLSYGTYDKFLQAALRNDFSAELNISASTISASSADDSFNDSGNGFGSVVAGQWIKTAGFTNSALNGYFLVTSATAGKLIVGSTLATETAGNAITIDGSVLRNGTSKKSFSIEKDFTDITQLIWYKGMQINTVSMEVAANANLSGSFSFMGLSSERATSTIGTGGPNAATTTPLMNAVNNVGDIREGGAAMTGIFIQSLGINVNNNLRPQDAIGTLGHIGIAYGKFNASGNITVYFANGDLYDKYVNNTESSFSYRLTDNSGNTYIFTFHRLKFSAGKVVAGSENSDVMMAMDYQAIKHATYGCTMQIDKFAA